MAKPILIIRIDRKIVGEQDLNGFSSAIEDRLNNEYHVIPVTILTDYNVEFEVLNTDKASELDIEKLKNDIKEMFKCPQ